MDLRTYREKLITYGLEEAIKYKNSFVQNTLYKYNALLDYRYVDYSEENKKKLDALEKNILWVSHFTRFNDPFEFKMLAIDKEKLEGTGWEVEDINMYLDLFRNLSLVSCFSSDGNNMPMWAHYANNHKGYCVKYSILDPNSIYPVIYEPSRVKSAVILTNLINEMFESYKKDLKEPTEKFYEYFSYFYLSLSCKHDFWKYENEYRLVYPIIDLNNKTGKLINLSDAGLKVDSIYIGYKCDEEYTDKLMQIGKNIGCEVYKMNFDEYSDDFKLISKKLI